MIRVAMAVVVVVTALSCVRVEPAACTGDCSKLCDASSCDTNPCDTNPCVGWTGTTCSVSEGQVRCLCDSGAALLDAGCNPANECPARHQTGDGAEPDECASLGHPIIAGVPVPRTLEPAADVDWFLIEVEASHAYTFSTEGLPTEIAVFDGRGTLLAKDFLGSARFLAPERTALRVRVRGLNDTDEGEYFARVQDLGPDDYVNTEALAERLPDATWFEGRVEYPGDLDVAWVELPALTAFTVLTGRDAGMGDVVIEIQRPGGVTELSPGQSTRITTSILEHIVLTARGREVDSLGFFGLALTVLGPDDHADDPIYATPLPVGGPDVQGAVQRFDDVDYLTAPQLAGHLYNLRLTGSTQVHVRVLDSLGRELSSNRPGPLLVWQAMTSEPILIKLVGPGANDDYSVGIDDLGRDDHADSVALATAFGPGTTVAGRLELMADVDVFSFSATPGRVFEVLSSSPEIRLEIRDAQGIKVAQGFSPLGYAMVTGGPHTLFVGRAQVLGLVSYVLTMNDLGVEDHGDTLATATLVTLGTAQTGNFGYGSDIDLFAVPVVAGHLYKAVVTGAAMSMAILDANNTMLQWGGPPHVYFYAESSAARFIRIGPSNTTGSYSLLVEDLGPDDHADTPGGATVISLDVPVPGWIQHPADRDFFSMPVVAGHRYGVTCVLTNGTSCGFELSAVDASGAISGSSTQYSRAGFLAAPNHPGLLIAIGSSGLYVPYSLLVIDLGVDDYGDTPALATEIVIGGPAITGNGAFMDFDTFYVDVAAGEIIALACTESLNPGCNIQMESAAGPTLVVNSQGTAPSVITTGFQGLTAGRWIVTVYSWWARVNYSLAATRTADDSTAPRALPLGSQLAGSIDYVGDSDDFTVQLTQGVTLNTSMTGGVEGRLFSPAGPQVNTLTNGSSFAPSTTGLYRIEIVRLGAATGGYSLSIQ